MLIQNLDRKGKRMTDHAGDLLDQLAETITDNADRKGFWDITDPDLNIPLKLALCFTEISEALEAHRELYDDAEADPLTGMTPMQEEDFTEELADAIIRVLDIAGGYELPIGDAIISKIEKNRARPPKHGKRY
jgi:NTP pyrophosphatase (non-canonical NTP hydrolase)